MSFSMGCFFLLTGLLSCAVARGCENVCCLTLFQIPFYFAMLFASLFIPNSAWVALSLEPARVYE